MTLGFCAFVQKFIDSRVAGKFAHSGECYKHAIFSLGLSEGWVEHPTLRRPSATTFGSPGASSSRHTPAPRKKSGAAKFFKNPWDMCKNTNDVAHQALVMSQDTRIRQNEFFASKNYPYPTPGQELNPVPMVNYVMPPLDDEMFQGYPMAFSTSRPSRTRTFAKDEIQEDEDEDEGEDEGQEDKDAADAESPPPPFV
jgi:hypothetical protein